MLPPLMFSEDEIEALVLGSRWVAHRGDERLAAAARNALAKIAAVLPADLRDELDAPTLLVGPGEPSCRHGRPRRRPPGDPRGAQARHRLSRRDGAATRRTIWPFALGFFDRVRVVVAWCELRQDFRHFRADRIAALTPPTTRYPRRRQALLKEWREREQAHVRIRS